MGPTGPFAARYHLRYRTGNRYPIALLRDFVMLLDGVPVPDANSLLAPLSRRTIKRVAEQTSDARELKSA